jgi:hypothetical protein
MHLDTFYLKRKVVGFGNTPGSHLKILKYSLTQIHSHATQVFENSILNNRENKYLNNK